MGLVFALAFITGIVGVTLFSGILTIGFASLAGLSSIGLGITGYAISTQ